MAPRLSKLLEPVLTDKQMPTSICRHQAVRVFEFAKMEARTPTGPLLQPRLRFPFTLRKLAIQMTGMLSYFIPLILDPLLSQALRASHRTTSPETMTQHALEVEDWQSDQSNDKPEQDKTSNRDSPPAYEALDGEDSTTAQTPQTSTSNRERSDSAPTQQQEPIYTWNNCESGGPWAQLRMVMVNDPAAAHWDPTGARWAAGLAVKCRDLPRLMREGFFWSAENILPEEGHMTNAEYREWARGLGRHAYGRVWHLADKSNGEAPLWVARLEVCSRSVELLGRFEVRNLSRNMVYEAFAWNAEYRAVYAFRHYQPDGCFNCIYDEMPMEGWWPWPGPMEGGRDSGSTRQARQPREPQGAGEPGDRLDSLSPVKAQPGSRHEACHPDQPRQSYQPRQRYQPCQPDQRDTSGCIVL